MANKTKVYRDLLKQMRKEFYRFHPDAYPTAYRAAMFDILAKFELNKSLEEK